MADLQNRWCARPLLWRNEGVSSYRKRPRDPGQLAKLMINIDSGEDREAPTSAKPLPPIRPKPSAASESRRRTTKRSRRSAGLTTNCDHYVSFELRSRRTLVPDTKTPPSGHAGG
jgi:hypothetical protein